MGDQNFSNSFHSLIQNLARLFMHWDESCIRLIVVKGHER